MTFTHDENQVWHIFVLAIFLEPDHSKGLLLTIHDSWLPKSGLRTVIRIAINRKLRSYLLFLVPDTSLGFRLMIESTAWTSSADINLVLDLWSESQDIECAYLCLIYIYGDWLLMKLKWQRKNLYYVHQHTGNYSVYQMFGYLHFYQCNWAWTNYSTIERGLWPYCDYQRFIILSSIYLKIYSNIHRESQ